MAIRAAATFVLVLQLSRLGLPALCPAARPASGPCSQAMSSSASGALVTASSQGSSCASTALCAAVPVAVPAPRSVVLTLAAASRTAGRGTQPLIQADPQPPLPPPPQ